MDGLQVGYASIDPLRQSGRSDQEPLELLQHELLAKGAPSVYYIVIYKYYHSIFFLCSMTGKGLEKMSYVV